MINIINKNGKQRRITPIISKVVIPILLTLMILDFSSCKKFIEADENPSLVDQTLVFKDDNTATSAMIGIYHEMSTNVINMGITNSMSKLAGLAADELIDPSGADVDAVEFEENAIRPENPNISNLWDALYKVMYNANAMVEGLGKSTSLSTTVKNQLLGEAKFIRAFCNFYLVNFFSDVPLVLTTDYNVNSQVTKMDASDIYKQIVTDLISAQELLVSNYLGSERTRPNSFTASAILAKVYLYLEDWSAAETYASAVIANPGYEIVQEFNSVFRKESKEAIWQMAPIDGYNITDEARFYVPDGTSPSLVLRNDFVDSFNATDQRLQNWIGSFVDGTQRVYYPHKYKLQEAGLPTAEYSIVLRLSEQYLIRAEARLNLNNLAGTIADLDVVRHRAGLPLIANENPLIDKESLQLLIIDERKKELFTEWGNRWFDLKRLNKAVNVLSPLKPDFTINDMLFPLPQIELDRNPNLGGQNGGY